MKLTPENITSLLVALALLLSAAHALGYVFTRLGQPRVIGEILGGLVLGPTGLGVVFPGISAATFPESGPVPLVLDATYQLGLLLLMFAAGAEIRAAFHRGERRTVTIVTVTGTLLPLLAGCGVLSIWKPEGVRGAAATDASFVLVFSVAIAVTSIPIISRILLDLGVLETSFARIVLTVAVVEDVILYVLLAVALGLGSRGPEALHGLPEILSLEPSGAASIAYHAFATVGFLAASLAVGPWLYRRALGFRYNVLKRGSAIAFQLVFMFVAVVAAVFLGVVALFGAFVAGIVVASSSAKGAARAREEIRSFSFAFFIPVYFGVVGLRLDLIREFDLWFFVVFLALACAAKWASVYLGARLAGEDHRGSTNLSFALNARGGPGIVLASVALDAGIISETFYSTLVLLAILTSLLAGLWLERVVRSGGTLRRGPSGTAPTDP